MMNNIPYLRKNISTLLALSAIALLSSPLVLFNLVPVQAQTNLIFRTPTPASGTSPTGEEFSLTFDAQGTPSSIDPQTAAITNGTMQITSNGQIAYSGNIQNGTFTNTTSGGSISASGPIDQSGDKFSIDTSCSSSDRNPINVDIQIKGGGGTIRFNGPVECSPSQWRGGWEDTTQSMIAGNSQDGDSKEYLTQLIGVLITLTRDALKKIQQHHSSNLLLIWLGTKQDRGEMRIYHDYK